MSHATVFHLRLSDNDNARLAFLPSVFSLPFPHFSCAEKRRRGASFDRIAAVRASASRAEICQLVEQKTRILQSLLQIVIREAFSRLAVIQRIREHSRADKNVRVFTRNSERRRATRWNNRESIARESVGEAVRGKDLLPRFGRRQRTRKDGSLFSPAIFN